MNLRNFAPNGDFRNFSKPDYLQIKEPSLKILKEGEQLGNRQVISKFTGWITVDEDTKNSRKNAPEVCKKLLTESQ